MVDNSDATIAIWDRKPSGTGNTVEYARKQGKPVLVIDPMRQEEKWLTGTDKRNTIRALAS